MKRILFSLFFMFSLIANTQEKIDANKEVIYSLVVGDEADQATYRATEEGFYSIGSPFIDSQGNILFYKAINDTRNFIKVSKGTITTLQYQGNLSNDHEQRSRNYNSQAGIIYDSEPLAFNGVSFYEYNFRSKIGSLKGGYYNAYPMLFGALLYSEKNKTGIAIIFNVNKPTDDFSVIPQNQLQTWLQTQPGGFTIGIDGLLYRNGILWSEKKAEGIAGDYIGKLMSGHNIYQSGRRFFRITNSTGALELELEIPWAEILGSGQGFNLYDYGLGPWGELYCLIAPFWDLSDKPWPPENSVSELVVVRNHLKYFGRLNIDAVRLRKEPNTTSEILGTYPAKTGFRILEKGAVEETIAGKKNVWYKVRLLDGKEGYFFGAFVHNLYDGPNGLPPPWPNVPDW